MLSNVVLVSAIQQCESTLSESHSIVSDSLQPHGLFGPWNSPGQSTSVGSLSLLQGIFPMQGSDPGLLHCRQTLYQLSRLGSPESTLRAHVFPPSCASFTSTPIPPLSVVMEHQAEFLVLHSIFPLGMYFPRGSATLFFFLTFCFNWRLIALQYCVGFCHIST